MAATLPNPSIVFVPLDVLTADELNQVVQNIAYLADLFPISTSNIGNGSITNEKLAALAVGNTNIANNTIGASKVSNATTGTDAIAPTNKNVIRLGNRKIMWGVERPTNVPSDTQTSRTVNFPEAFTNPPVVNLTVGSWEALGFIEGNGANATSFSYIFSHNLGSPTNPTIWWIAIG